jgi:hypothetical protein
MKSLFTSGICVFAIVLSASTAKATVLSVDFDSLTAGTIDTTNTTSPTLNELNAATTGGTWDLNPDSVVTHEIQSDAGGQGDKAFLSRASSAQWGAGIDLDNAVDISEMTSDLVINFTTATRDSTGYTRDTHWYLFDGTTELVDIEMDDGYVWLNGSNLGLLSGHADTVSVLPWDSTDQWVYSVLITIDNAGGLDLEMSTNESTPTTVSGSTTIPSTADFDRIEMEWDHASSKMGVYFGEIEIIPEPTSLALLVFGGLTVLGRRSRQVRRAPTLQRPA